jgi:thioredoxin 1
MSLVHITDANFQEEVLDSKGLVLVDFWAPWCAPCRMLGPIIEEVAEDAKESIKVCKMNVDENREFPMKYGIMSIPTVMLFKDGELAESMIGLQDKSAYLDAIQRYS